MVIQRVAGTVEKQIKLLHLTSNIVIIKNNAELIGLSLISKHSLCYKEDKNSTIN